jgi:hypothetical protein
MSNPPEPIVRTPGEFPGFIFPSAVIVTPLVGPVVKINPVPFKVPLTTVTGPLLFAIEPMAPLTVSTPPSTFGFPAGLKPTDVDPV